jgi:hypothetical protein
MSAGLSLGAKTAPVLTILCWGLTSEETHQDWSRRASTITMPMFCYTRFEIDSDQPGPHV